MTRGFLGTSLWIGLAACIGVGLFLIKHEVKLKEHRLDEINAQIQAHQESVHVLRAEWAYLNDPVRLRALAEKYLGMHPVQPNQIASLDVVLRDGLPAPVPTRLADGRTRPIAPAAIAARTETPAPTGLARNTATAARSTAASPSLRPAAVVRPALARAEPGSATSPVTMIPSTGATTPATGRGTRSMVIRSPALAQGTPDFEAEAR